MMSSYRSVKQWAEISMLPERMGKADQSINANVHQGPPTVIKALVKIHLAK